jgi:hypothetical protein
MKRPTFGFTLVETIFSSLFISLTVLAIVNLFPGAYMSVKKSETRLQGDIIAESIIEDLRTIDFNKEPRPIPFDGLDPTSVPAAHSVEYDSIVVDGTRYFPTVTVYNLVGTDPKIVKGVRVTIEASTNVGATGEKEGYRIQTPTVHETCLHSLR